MAKKIIANHKTEEIEKTLTLKSAEGILIRKSILPFPAKISAPENRKTEIESVTVGEYLKMVDAGVIGNYDKQRRPDAWTVQQALAFCFSLENRYAVPMVILRKSADGKTWEIMDGQQRTQAILSGRAYYNAIINKCKSVLAAMEDAKKAVPKEDEGKDETANKDAIKDMMADAKHRLNWLLTATIPLCYNTGLADDEAAYIYAACNAAKAQSGDEKGIAYLPNQAVDTVRDIASRATMYEGVAQGRFAIYCWAALASKPKKAVAGFRAFQNLKGESLLDGFVFPQIPSWFDDFITGLSNLSTDKKDAYGQYAFSKPGVLVPFIQGLVIYAKNHPESDIDFVQYALKNLETLLTTKVTYTDKVARKGSKNGDVTAKKHLVNVLSDSGSAESLVYRKATAWCAAFEVAEKMFHAKQDGEQKTDKITDALNKAGLEGESAE